MSWKFWEKKHVKILVKLDSKWKNELKELMRRVTDEAFKLKLKNKEVERISKGMEKQLNTADDAVRDINLKKEEDITEIDHQLRELFVFFSLSYEIAGNIAKDGKPEVQALMKDFFIAVHDLAHKITLLVDETTKDNAVNLRWAYHIRDKIKKMYP